MNSSYGEAHTRLFVSALFSPLLFISGSGFGADCVGAECNIYRGAEYYGDPLPKSQRELDEEKLPAKERNALLLMREKSRLRQKEMERQDDIKRRAEQMRQFYRQAEQEQARQHEFDLQRQRLELERRRLELERRHLIGRYDRRH